MATGGDFSRTLDLGSEPFYDFTCSLCEEEGKHTKAARYCEECIVFLCDPCVKNHNKYPLHKRHQLLDESRFVAVAQSKLVSFPTKRCLKHPGELVNIYCGDHDIVCCSSCKVLGHSSCANTKHLIDAANGIKKSEEYQNITQETNVLLNDANRVHKDQKADISRIETERQKMKDIISGVKKNVNSFFHDLEQKCVQVLNNKADNVLSDCSQDVKDLTVMIPTVESMRQQLDSFRGFNECDLFVQVKMGQQLICNARQKVLNISKSVQNNSINFMISPTLERLLCSVEELGTISDMSMNASQLSTVDKDTAVRKPRASRLPSQTSLNKHGSPKTPPYCKAEIKEKTDYNVCDITGICQIPDGTILIVDYNNTKLKRLGNKYRVFDSLKLTSNPDSICNGGPGEVAVSLFAAKEVQFISVKAELKVTKSFRTGNFCRGIVYVNEKVYVCCGSTCEPSSWCIEVYDNAGLLQLSIQGFPSLPLFITATEDGQHLLLTSCHSSSVIMMDLTGNGLDTFENNEMKVPKGICTENENRIFICGYGNNTIGKLVPSSREMEIILTDEDGLKSPYTICYDRKHSTLLVFCDESGQLLAINLE